MKFYMPVKVFDEPECVKNHGDELASLGRKALIITGKSSAFGNGSFDDVTDVLKNNGIEYSVFSEVEENPSVETVFSAGEKYAGEGIEFVIGIGGGSAMDAAKAVALVLKHPEADLSYLYDGSKPSDALPVVCIPTTCGTGSEVTGVSVLTRHDKGTKISMVHRVFPQLALIDGKYLKSASKTLVVNSSVDALSHLYESVLNAKADDYVRTTAYSGLRMWSNIKDILAGEREADAEDYSLLMRSSALAGMSIALSGTSLPHALSYIITYDLAMPHGKAVGYFLPGFIKAAPAVQRDELLKLSGFADEDDFAAYIYKVLGRPEITAEELDKTYAAVRNNAGKMKSASFAVDDDILKDIVYFAYS